MLKRLRNLVTPPAVEQRAALLAGKHVTYTLKRSGRRRSIGLRIDDRGLTVSIPLRASERWLLNVLQDKAHWVVEKLDGWQTRKPVETRWADGEGVPFLGEMLVLRVRRSLFAAPPQQRGRELWVFVAGGQEDETIRENRFPLPPLPNPLSETTSHSTRLQTTAAKSLVIPQAGEGANESLRKFDVDDSDAEHVEQQVAHWYRQQAGALFVARAAHYASLMEVEPRGIKLSVAKTQWGCCTARGTVRLNLSLIKLPLRLVDYVVVHELAHLREMNHSAEFWSVVAGICPDYVKLRRELKAVAL